MRLVLPSPSELAIMRAELAAHNASVPPEGLSFRDTVRAMRQAGVPVTLDRGVAVELGLATKHAPADANGMVEIPAIVTRPVVLDRQDAIALGIATSSTPVNGDGQIEIPPMTAYCQHDEVVFECPCCGGDVDSDTEVCLRCREAVGRVRRCVTCEEDVTAYYPYTVAYVAALSPRDRAYFLKGSRS